MGEVMKSLACSGWEGKRLCRRRLEHRQGRDVPGCTPLEHEGGLWEVGLVAQRPAPALHLRVTPRPVPWHPTFQNPLQFFSDNK